MVFVLLAVGAVFFLIPQKTKNNTEVTTPTAPTPATVTSESSNQTAETKKIRASVLMYHHVGPLPDGADEIRKGLTISADEFEDQLKFFRDNGYTPVSFKRFDDMLKNRAVPEKLVILTFDDGYDDNYTYAYELMKKYNVTGTFFIITNKIGKREYMNEDQIVELAKSGNEIGSHSVSHPSLDKYKGDFLNNELSKSKETLEKIISNEVISFCYPAGKYNEETLKAVKDAGYQYAVTTRSSNGIIDLDNRFEISRYRISAGRNIEAMLR